MENIEDIQSDINWLAKIIENRIKNIDFDFFSFTPPKLSSNSFYSSFIESSKLDIRERLILILTLIPNIDPIFLYHKFNLKFKELNSDYDIFIMECPRYKSGILKSPSSDSFLPTGQTVLYLIAGDNMKLKAEIIKEIYENKFFIIDKNIIIPVVNSNYDPLLANIFTLDQHYVVSFITDNNEHVLRLQKNEKLKEKHSNTVK